MSYVIEVEVTPVAKIGYIEGPYENLIIARVDLLEKPTKYPIMIRGADSPHDRN